MALEDADHFWRLWSARFLSMQRRVGHVDNVEDDRLMVLCAVHGILCISENSAESWWMVTNSS
tara:strand:+ start:64 stop:252 length:189 start_codon:yes stop_codon:yes gene_type:complete